MILKGQLSSFMILALAAVTSAASDERTIGCYVDGACLQSVSLTSLTSNSVADCYSICQATTGCNYFTQYEDSNLCFAFLDCNTFSTDDCEDCISGKSG